MTTTTLYLKAFEIDVVPEVLEFRDAESWEPKPKVLDTITLFKVVARAPDGSSWTHHAVYSEAGHGLIGAQVRAMRLRNEIVALIEANKWFGPDDAMFWKANAY